MIGQPYQPLAERGAMTEAQSRAVRRARLALGTRIAATSVDLLADGRARVYALDRSETIVEIRYVAPDGSTEVES